MPRLAILFLTHLATKSILQRFQTIHAACSDKNVEVILLFDETRAPCPAISSAWIHRFDLRALGAMGLPSPKHVVPGYADYPLIHFYRAHPDFDFYWVVEHDVWFTGDWRFFVSECAKSNADLLGTYLERHATNPAWHWWDSLRFKETAIERSRLIRAFLPVYRLSRGACKKLLEEYRKGWSGHAEVRLPTVLHALGGTLEDLGGDGEFVRLGNRNRFYIGSELLPPAKCTFRWRPAMNQPGTMPNMLWHPVKGEDFSLEPINSEMLLEQQPSSGGRNVSLCMIVRNEERNLRECLECIADLVGEIIIVDTGSTDGTKAIAASFGAKVLDFPWIDDFSAARNESLRYATRKWALFVDADDRIDSTNRQRLKDLFNRLPDNHDAFMMRQASFVRPETKDYWRIDRVHLFRNHPLIRWTYRVHEQIAPAVKRLGGRIVQSDIVIHHRGYQDADSLSRKNERNLRLLCLDVKENPNDPFVLFNMGWTLAVQGQCTEAMPYLERALDLDPAKATWVRMLYVIAARIQREQAQLVKALETCRRGRLMFPDDAELLNSEGLLFFARGDLANAADRMERLLRTTSVTEPLFGFRSGISLHITRHNLAVVYRDQGRSDQAESQWRQLLAERPDYKDALLGLAQLLAKQDRWSAVDELCARLEHLPEGKTSADVLRVCGFLAANRVLAARHLLEQVIERAPNFLWPKLMLARILLKEGTESTKAAALLRSILTVEADPKEVEIQAEARSRLAALQASFPFV